MQIKVLHRRMKIRETMLVGLFLMLVITNLLSLGETSDAEDTEAKPRVRLQKDSLQKRSSMEKRDKKQVVRYMRDQHAQVSLFGLFGRKKYVCLISHFKTWNFIDI
jgi:hypothetical protein